MEIAHVFLLFNKHVNFGVSRYGYYYYFIFQVRAVYSNLLDHIPGNITIATSPLYKD